MTTVKHKPNKTLNLVLGLGLSSLLIGGVVSCSSGASSSNEQVAAQNLN
ncbi:MAG: hypothetical protein K2Y14_01750 [Burkholderiales bacterium]|nr:hypothetical protein [Burkholderiales bacterium]